MSLFRLVYASTSLLSGKPDLAREQIEEILIASRRNNEAAEITGSASVQRDQFFPGARRSSRRGRAPLRDP